jgi:uroporphyrin-3 C-methyltransferase
MLLAALAAGALALAYTSQQRLRTIEAELVRRQQETAQAAGEARLLSRQAETSAREVAAKMALLEARLGETVMQRSQFEDLLQSLARSRDENVLADIEAAVRVAQQQSAITGSADPLTQVLRQAEERLARYAQPRLERVRRAVAQDLERIRAAGSPDLALLASRLDDLMRQVDDLPLLVVPQHPAARRGAAPSTPSAPSAPSAPAAAPAGTPRPDVLDSLRQAWDNLVRHTWNETRALVRVTRIDDPQAMLLAPEQAYFLRENVKLRLLNARLALLSRQFDVAQSDLRESLAALERYFDRSARRTVLAMDGLRQVMAQTRAVVLPRPDATLAAIATAAAGR